MENKHIIVGMSGGVDSAVAAYLLKRQGFKVTGVFMKNWDEKDEFGECSAAADLEDVRAVCETLEIPYYSVNFEKEYYERVFSYFLSEYEKGRTPNPDVLCNSEIKFKAFLELALKSGADYMATGHYVQREDTADGVLLKKGADKGKDQSYFLCMLNQRQLEKAVFPIGGLQKAQVRDTAHKLGLTVADKKDSTGICFIGERRFKEFLQNFLPAKPGEIRTLEGKLIGHHDGLMYYTIGQRRGLNIGGCGTGERWFVAKKDLEHNILYVVQGRKAPELFSHACKVSGINFISRRPGASVDLQAKFRYRQPDQKIHAEFSEDKAYLTFEEPQRAVTPGQYAVFYDGEICLGGGIIEEVEA